MNKFNLNDQVIPKVYLAQQNYIKRSIMRHPYKVIAVDGDTVTIFDTRPENAYCGQEMVKNAMRKQCPESLGVALKFLSMEVKAEVLMHAGAFIIANELGAKPCECNEPGPKAPSDITESTSDVASKKNKTIDIEMLDI